MHQKATEKMYKPNFKCKCNALKLDGMNGNNTHKTILSGCGQTNKIQFSIT